MAAAGQGGEQAGAGCEQPRGSVGGAPVARGQRPAERIHRADGQHARQRGGDVGTFAAVVAGRRHDQDPAPDRPTDRVGQDRLGRRRRPVLPGADVDDRRPVLHRHQDRAGQLELRARRPERFARPRVGVAEDRHDQAPAAGRQAEDRAIGRVPAEDQARHRRAVPRGGAPTIRHGGRRGLDHVQPRAGERRMAPVDRPVEHRHHDPGIAQGLGPELGGVPGNDGPSVSSYPPSLARTCPRSLALADPPSSMPGTPRGRARPRETSWNSESC